MIYFNTLSIPHNAIFKLGPSKLEQVEQITVVITTPGYCDKSTSLFCCLWVHFQVKKLWTPLYECGWSNSFMKWCDDASLLVLIKPGIVWCKALWACVALSVYSWLFLGFLIDTYVHGTNLKLQSQTNHIPIPYVKCCIQLNDHNQHFNRSGRLCVLGISISVSFNI